jgi:hypothetical protein
LLPTRTYDENLANCKVYFIQNLVNFGHFSMKNSLNRSKSYLSSRNLAKVCKYKKHTKKITQLLSLQFHKAQESNVNTQSFFTKILYATSKNSKEIVEDGLHKLHTNGNRKMTHQGPIAKHERIISQEMRQKNSQYDF